MVFDPALAARESNPVGRLLLLNSFKSMISKYMSGNSFSSMLICCFPVEMTDVFIKPDKILSI